MERAQAAHDAVVIGSGIGGLTAAAALAKRGRRVLVVERHSQLGGMTQTFRRHEYEFATGVHYLGNMNDVHGPEGQFARTLHWLTGGRIAFAPIPSPYDVVRLPGFEFPIEAPLAAFVARLKAEFPEEAAAIDAYFAACRDAQRAAMTLFRSRAVPPLIGSLLRWLGSGRTGRALGTTVADAVRGFRDRRLAALLAARWQDYGMPPDRAPLLVYAVVMGNYFGGASYPVGGPARFASAFADAIASGGGELRTGTEVTEIRIEEGRACGVRLATGESIDAPVVISDMGGRNTAAALPPMVAPAWRAALAPLRSGLSYVCLYVGLRGDIRAQGATAANLWIYDSDDVGRYWRQPADEEAPGLFVTFPSLKDPAHADPMRHTAEVGVMCDFEPFARWADSSPGRRPEEYEATKAWVAERLLAQFKRHFPRLAPMVDFYEMSTPLSQASYVAADRGAMYGIEMSAERLGGNILGVRTPVPGLLLAGQDALSLGIPGAFMGGYMAAAAVEPRLWLDMNA